MTVATNKELRSYRGSGRVQIRSKGKTGRIATGYAIVFAPSRSQDLGGFVEQIDSNSIDLSTVGNVYALRGHDTSRQLASTDTGTLRLFKDTRGIRFEIDLPDTTDGNDLAELFSRTGPNGSDAGQCSFGFIATRDNWKELTDGTILRTILDMTLLEVSIGVVFPAYTDTTSSIRSAPARIRAKLALKRDEELGEDDDESVSYDEALCNCRCSNCQSDDHAECSASTRCAKRSWLDNNCDCSDPDADDACSCDDDENRAQLLSLLIRRSR